MADFVISIATTPKRINDFIYGIPKLNTILPPHCKNVLINCCPFYKRFGEADFKLSEYSKKILCKYDKFNLWFCYDYGPMTKLIGAMNYNHSKNTKYSILILDDDIDYSYKLLNTLTTRDNRMAITSGRGFRITNGNYDPDPFEAQYVEGFAGIYFPYEIIDYNVYFFAEFYKCLEPKPTEAGCVNDFLIACFLGDDYVISKFYKKKLCLNYLCKDIIPYNYGNEADALHNNTIHGSNMGTYNFLEEQDNKKIFNTFTNKINLNQHIKRLSTNI